MTGFGGSAYLSRSLNDFELNQIQFKICLNFNFYGLNSRFRTLLCMRSATTVTYCAERSPVS